MSRQLSSVGCALVTTLHWSRLLANTYGSWTSHPPLIWRRCHRSALGRRGGQHPHVLPLGREQLQGAVVVAGRDEHVGLGVGHDLRRHRLGDGGVQRHDAAEGGHGVALERPVVGGQHAVGHGRPAGVGVLDHDGGRRPQLGQLVDQPPGGVGVVQVEVGKLHAAVLHHLVPPARPADLPVAGPPLVRVLAVAEGLGLFEGKMEGRGQAFACRSARRTSWRWRRRRRRYGRRRRRPGADADPSDRAPSRRSSSSTAGYSSGSTTEPTWAQFLAAARTMVGPPTSISSIDGWVRNGYRLHTTIPIGSMPWPDRSDTCSGLERSASTPPCRRGVQGLDPPAEHLRRLGHRLHGGVGDPGLVQRRRGAAAGDQLVAQVDQAAGEVLQPGLVVHRQQDPHAVAPPRICSIKRRIVSGYNLRSTTLILLVEGLLGIARFDPYRLLGQDGPGVDLLGGDVHRRAGHLHPQRRWRHAPRATL